MCDGFESERNQCEDLGSRQGMQAEKGPHSFTSQLDPHFTTTGDGGSRNTCGK